MNPRTELEARYPSADFSVYFRTAEACRTVKGLNTHDHHLCPRKQFPEFVDSPENLITVTIEDHAFLHKLLEAACGIKAPATALFDKSLCGASIGGRLSVAAMNASLTFQKRSAMSKEAWLKMLPEQKTKRQRNAGRAGGKKSWNILTEESRARRLSHWKMQTAAQLSEAGRKGVHVRLHVNRNIVSSTCELCTL